MQLGGHGCTVDYVAAAATLTALARKGNPQAAFSLAGLFAEGKGVEQSVSRATGLYDLCGTMGLIRG